MSLSRLRHGFLRSEHGAVTVDWVVLTAAAAGVALATSGLLVAGIHSQQYAMEEAMGTQGFVGETFAAAMRNYQPFDQAFHEAVYNDVSSLSDADLDILEAFVNDMNSLLASGTEEEVNALTDMTYAVGLTYAERIRERPNGTGSDPTELERIATELGWHLDAWTSSNSTVALANTL